MKANFQKQKCFIINLVTIVAFSDLNRKNEVNLASKTCEIMFFHTAFIIFLKVGVLV